MQKPKQFSGKELIKIFERYGFEQVRTKGSHVRMTYQESNHSYHITIPLHNPIKKGLLHAIIKEFESLFGKTESEKNFY